MPKQCTGCRIEGSRMKKNYAGIGGQTFAGGFDNILAKLSSIKTAKEKDYFIDEYQDWINNYRGYVLSLPRTQVAFKDIKRTMVLINNALADMFYYLHDPNVHSTTNALEGFHSRLKADYQRHRGLSREHKLQYLKWYCYFENTN